MNARSTLFLCLIALTTGQAFGEPDLKAQLSEIKGDSAILKQAWTDLSVESDKNIYPKVAELQKTVGYLSGQIYELPDDSGNFLYDLGIHNLLKDTTKLLTDSYHESLKALKKQKSDENLYNENLPRMLISISIMIEHVSSIFQQKLNQWSNNLDGNRQRNLQTFLVDHRRALLEPLEMMASKVCEMEKDSWINKILNSLKTAAGEVTVASCNGLFSCVDSLVPIAGRIVKNAQCS